MFFTKLRAALVIATMSLGTVIAVQAVGAETPPTADVRSYGALGDGTTNDTGAIQRANDAVAAQGGGTVVFPAGTYVAAGVRQDSGVEFVSTESATLKHPDGVTNTDILSNRVVTKKGWIVEGSTRLSVPDTRGVLPGAWVGVRGAGGASSVQATTLQWPMTAGATALQVYMRNGWATAGTNFVLVDNEIIAYTGYANGTMQNLKRGQLGTKASDHSQGARIAQLNVLYAKAVSVGPNWIELDRVAVQAVSATSAFVGSINMAVRGLSFDGNRRVDGSAANPFPLNYELARWVTVEGCTIRNGDHGAINFDKATSDSRAINNTLVDNGTPSAQLGAGIWLYRGASDNVVTGNTIHGNSYVGIQSDDRTETATEWDAPPNRNGITGNQIDIPATGKNAAIFVIGSEGNIIEGNDVRSTLYGIWLAKSTQGTQPALTCGNEVKSNQLNGHTWGLYVTGSDNTFQSNVITSVTTPIYNTGVGNLFL